MNQSYSITMATSSTSTAREAKPPTSKTQHANRHIGDLLKIPERKQCDEQIQYMKDGRSLTAQRLLDNSDITLTRPILVDDVAQSIGLNALRMPEDREVTVRDVADIIGHHYPIHVIDVEYQEELEGWTMTDLVEYFEDEDRLSLQKPMGEERAANKRPLRRKAAKKCMEQRTLQRPRVLNQISLEFSKTPLRERVQSPQFVRDLDWIDHAWPRRKTATSSASNLASGLYPTVQYYCLISAAGCFTDFHIDFGGTAVWYHILSGEKVFCLIPPTKENLESYEKWLCSPDQSSTFLADMIANPEENVFKVSLKASQTLIIPTAWIHAVYTPEDSLVLGGNFMHGLDMSLQLQVHCIEARTRVQERFRFPYFVPLNFYAGGYYLDKLRRGNISQREVEGLGDLIEALGEWWKIHANGQSQVQTGPTVVTAALECTKQNGCASVEEFLKELQSEFERVSTDGIVPNPTLSSSLLTPTELIVTSTEKPKLRLSLKGRSTAVPPKPVTSGSDSFRIVVSSSKSSIAPTKKSKRVREDTEWLDEGASADTEWVPTSRSNIKSTRSPAKPQRNKGTPGPVAQPPPKKTSARQRLMKRFR